MLVEDEDGNVIFNGETGAGMADFEENVVRKAENTIGSYEGQLEALAQLEMDRQRDEGEEYVQATDHEGGKELVDREANTGTPF